jgi:hypothetical protein
MVPNLDTISNMKRKRSINGAVIGLLVGMVVGTVIGLLVPTIVIIMGGDYDYDWALCGGWCFGAPSGAIGGLLGGLFGGSTYPKPGDAKKALVSRAIWGGIGGLIATIITFLLCNLEKIMSGYYFLD